MIEVHAIITINTINVCYTLLELATSLDAILHSHITHPVPPRCNIFGTIALLDQALYQVSFVSRLATFQLLDIFLMVDLPEHSILFPH